VASAADLRINISVNLCIFITKSIAFSGGVTVILLNYFLQNKAKMHEIHLTVGGLLVMILWCLGLVLLYNSTLMTVTNNTEGTVS